MNVKTLEDIQIKQSTSVTDAGLANDIIEKNLTAAEKLSEYTLRLGHSSPHILGALVQLLTEGKVRLDFREYHERLQLIHKTDMMSRPEAILHVEGYLASLKRTGDTAAKSKATQKLIIQVPHKEPKRSSK